MYTVVQFVENQKFKVMAVPSEWVRKNFLFWPKLSNVKIEALRIGGGAYDGPTKKIPMIMYKKFKNLSMAEEAADDLSKREVSDVDNKRKRLKPMKKPKLASRKDYNLMLKECGNVKRKVMSEANGKPTPEPGKSKLHSQATVPLADALVQQNSVSVISQKRDASDASTELSVQHPATATKQLVQLSASTQESNSDSFVLPCTMQPLENSQTFRDQPPITADILTELSPTLFDTKPLYVDHEGVMYYAPVNENETVDNPQIADTLSYEQMKSDLKEFIESAVENAVEKCFQTNFARFAALLEIQGKNHATEPPLVDAVERHARISTEEELSDWNIKLNSKELCRKYLEYFSKIIIPCAYKEKGDNACYTLVDCLFTREFWTTMTWTGISRGNKAKRGFREYGNVTQLLSNIVQVGDPSYTARKLEMFCRNRLFRYCKSRSTNRQLRRSACRKRRGYKSTKEKEEIRNEDEDTQNSNETNVAESMVEDSDLISDDDSGDVEIESSDEGDKHERSAENE